jgi:hypothetical protein
MSAAAHDIADTPTCPSAVVQERRDNYDNNDNNDDDKDDATTTTR